METIPEVVYWAVLLYTPIYWFIGLIVFSGCFIAGTIWSTLACSLRENFLYPFRAISPFYSITCTALERGVDKAAEWLSPPR
jgi:hypothetical protein